MGESDDSGKLGDIYVPFLGQYDATFLEKYDRTAKKNEIKSRGWQARFDPVFYVRGGPRVKGAKVRDPENWELRLEPVVHQFKHQPSGEELSKYPLPKFLPGNDSNYHIAIVGRTSTGKSSLINALRNLKEKDDDFAPVGFEETTQEPTKYFWKENMYLWDFPGGGTLSHKKENYLYELGLRWFSCVVISFSSSFQQLEGDILQIAHEFQMPFFLVKNRVDEDINNSRNRGLKYAEIKSQIRKQTFDKANKYCPGITKNQIYLIRTNNKFRLDFPKFEKDLVENFKNQK